MATQGNNLSAYDKSTIPDASSLRIGIVVSEWNSDITEGLYQGAYEALIDVGVKEENIGRMNVPGTFELTYGCRKMMLDNKHMKNNYRPDAVIAIGNVIRGETAHFDFVCHGVTQGITQLNLEGKCPIIFCVLTDDTKQQSIDRSGGVHGNKGTEAAIAAVKMCFI